MGRPEVRTYTTLGGEVRSVAVGPPKRRAPKKPRADGLSATQALTKRNNDTLAAGRHPATGLRLAPYGATCGACAHHQAYEYHSKTYHKCELHRLGQSHSSASDVRVGWPACMAFKAEERA